MWGTTKIFLPASLAVEMWCLKKVKEGGKSENKRRDEDLNSKIKVEKREGLLELYMLVFRAGVDDKDAVLAVRRSDPIALLGVQVVALDIEAVFNNRIHEMGVEPGFQSWRP